MGDGGVVLARPPGRTVRDITLHAIVLDPEYLLVQTAGVSKQHPGPGFDYDYVDSRILRISDGTEVSRTRNLPVVLAISDGKALIGNSNEAEFGLEVRPVLTGRRRR